MDIDLQHEGLTIQYKELHITLRLTNKFHWTMYKLFCQRNGLAEGNYKSAALWRDLC